jgi:hypothetical protein
MPDLLRPYTVYCCAVLVFIITCAARVEQDEIMPDARARKTKMKISPMSKLDTDYKANFRDREIRYSSEGVRKSA